MTRRCTHESCFADTTCALGHLDRSACEHWKESEEGEADAAEVSQKPMSDVPWNGYALGTSDLAILGGRSQPLVVGLLGPPDAGKTSLLAYLYMWLMQHGTLDEWLFAGSWTLGGWESVVQYCRWTSEPPPSFPPHTSSTGRHPGVLHVTLRNPANGGIRDVLFTDAPGEWFTQWSRVPGHATAAGARWVIEHSDVLLLLIDSAALADPDKLPATRRATRDLIERVAAGGQRPLAIVWTKDDVDVPQLARASLMRTCSDYVPYASIEKTTIHKPETIEACFVCALRLPQSAAAASVSTEPRLSNDPFLAFRGIYVNA